VRDAVPQLLALCVLDRLIEGEPVEEPVAQREAGGLELSVVVKHRVGEGLKVEERQREGVWLEVTQRDMLAVPVRLRVGLVLLVKLRVPVEEALIEMERLCEGLPEVVWEALKHLDALGLGVRESEGERDRVLHKVGDAVDEKLTLPE